MIQFSSLVTYNQCDPVFWDTAIKLADKHSPQAVKYLSFCPLLSSAFRLARVKRCVPCRALAVCTFSYAGMVEQEAAVIVLDKMFNESP
jgi:hypothetical protein